MLDRAPAFGHAVLLGFPATELPPDDGRTAVCNGGEFVVAGARSGSTNGAIGKLPTASGISGRHDRLAIGRTGGPRFFRHDRRVAVRQPCYRIDSGSSVNPLKQRSAENHRNLRCAYAFAAGRSGILRGPAAEDRLLQGAGAMRPGGGTGRVVTTVGQDLRPKARIG